MDAAVHRLRTHVLAKYGVVPQIGVQSAHTPGRPNLVSVTCCWRDPRTGAALGFGLQGETPEHMHASIDQLEIDA